MTLFVEQTYNGLYDAKFDIIPDGGPKSGDVNFQGNIGSIDGVFSLVYENLFITIPRTSVKEARQMLGTKSTVKPYRPYAVRGQGPEEKLFEGVVFHEKKRIGLFREISCYHLFMGGQDWRMYVIELGTEGIRMPIYKEESMVAEITKPCLVRDDIHDFCVKILQKDTVVPSLCLCCYVYVMTYYKAGQVCRGIQEIIRITKEPFLLRKLHTGKFQ